MSGQRTIRFENLSDTDLFVDALYKGGTSGNSGDDPISKILHIGNQGGFRYVGSSKQRIKLCVLYSSLLEIEWPDNLDLELGRFVYYGDNRRPGHDLHSSPGNRILREAFENLHSGRRDLIPPFFVFTKGGEGRDVVFRGLAVPGYPGVSAQEDLVALWRSKSGRRFQNYKAVFTILDENVVRQAWIRDLHEGRYRTENAPRAWTKWVDKGEYDVLVAPAARAYRTKDEQLPAENTNESEMIETIVTFFKSHPKGEYAFEHCAAEIVRLMDANVSDVNLTRPWRDGGRDAIGSYRIGPLESKLTIEFALEAKCKQRDSGSGVREVSRLISRLRHRQFGIFVTTSYVSTQAYREIVEDRHPVLVVSAVDIAYILLKSGYSTREKVRRWLEDNFLDQETP